MAQERPVARRILADDRARRLLFVAVGAGALSVLFYVAWAILLSTTVARVFLDGQDLGAVAPILGAMLFVLVVRSVLAGGQELLLQRAASRIKGGLRSRFAKHVLDLGPAYVGAERSGELVNTALGGIERLDEYVTQYLPARYLAFLVPAAIFLAILLLDPLTTLVLLFAGPILVLMLALIGGRARELTERRFADMSWMSAHFLDMLQGLSTLKAFGRSREQAASIRVISQEFGDTTMEVLRTAFQTSLVLEWAATAATALVALELSLRLMADALPFQRALAVLILTPEFFLPLRQLALRYHAGTEGEAAAKRVFAVLDSPVPAPKRAATDGQPPVAAPDGGTIRFHDVSFAYAQGDRPALVGFSLTVSAGQTVALVGSTGAGKSTVANLLLRFLEPDSGRIEVQGVPLWRIDKEAWRQQVAWVPQHPHLFYGTVMENIRLARPDAPAAAVIAAARAAHAHAFIRDLPQGYDSPIGEQGVRLSGGQRQRLALARAFLKDAPFVVLDEATAHVDPESEILIRAALRQLLSGRTALIIAHRLRLAQDASLIAVMANGRVIEEGAHEQLLASGVHYRQLVAAYEGIPIGEGNR